MPLGLRSGRPSRAIRSRPKQLIQRVPAWQSESGADALFAGQDWSQDAGLIGLLELPLTIDRAGFQRLVLALSLLALDVHWSGDAASARQASRLIRYWFTDDCTCMHPSGRQSYQVEGAPPAVSVAGAPSFRDLWVLLDVFRLLARESVLDQDEQAAIRDWLEQWLAWLSSGRQELLATAVHGALLTTHHLLSWATSVFLGRSDISAECLEALPELLDRQFAGDGAPKHLVWLVPGHHGRLFNLQAWANLSVLCRGLGVDITSLEGDQGCGLRLVYERLVDDILSSGQRVNGAIQEELDWLMLMAQMFGHGMADWRRPFSGGPDFLPDLMHPSYGIPPFWRLCLPS
ncbi:MAG: alginate lyase family protein [Synechococcaceae cyanobacterium]|nr:alginate lyase family protein [Synechococcaceae cyanobacterium]